MAVSRSGRARAAVLQFPRNGRVSPTGVARLLPSGRALLIGFALIAAAGLAYFLARETSVFAVRSVDVSGAPPRVAAHVRAALQPLEGTSLLALNGTDVRARLQKLPDVASVTYDRDFPHTLRVEVVPAHSIAVVRRGADAWIVASSGRVVRQIGPRGAPRLPRIWMPTAADVEVGTTLSEADALHAISVLAAARADGFGARISTVRSGAELTFVLASGLEVRFGDDSALQVKLAVARAILPSLGGDGYLDVSAPDRPVAGGESQVSG